jgi:hypothetical protein
MKLTITIDLDDRKVLNEGDAAWAVALALSDDSILTKEGHTLRPSGPVRVETNGYSFTWASAPRSLPGLGAPASHYPRLTGPIKPNAHTKIDESGH